MAKFFSLDFIVCQLLWLQLCAASDVINTTCSNTDVNIVIDTNAIPADQQGLNTDNLHVGVDEGDVACVPTETGGVLTFQFSLTSCHPVTEQDESRIKYRYDISSANYTNGEPGITREQNVGMTVTCSYGRTGSASSMYTGRVTIATFTDEFLGTLQFIMGLYRDAGYTDVIQNTETVIMNDPIYARIDMSTSAAWNMYVTDCVTSPTEGGVALKYDLITAGCFADPTMAVNPVVDTLRSYGFKFDAYRFKGASTNEVYITCDVLVCKPDSIEESCVAASACVEKRDVRALAPIGNKHETPSDTKMFQISHGPYNVRKN